MREKKRIIHHYIPKESNNNDRKYDSLLQKHKSDKTLQVTLSNTREISNALFYFVLVSRYGDTVVLLTKINFLFFLNKFNFFLYDKMAWKQFSSVKT